MVMLKNQLIREYYRIEDQSDVRKYLNENELREVDNGAMYLVGIVQAADTLNENGRIYPRPILLREVVNYGKIVAESRALGELDHPNCFIDTAQILSKDGWKDLKDAEIGESVYTLNTNTGDIELQEVFAKTDQAYEGKMIRFKSRNIDTLVTPNHRFYLIDRYGRGSFATARQIIDNRKKYNHSYIPKLGSWEGNRDEFFTIDAIPEDYYKKSAKNIREKNGFDKPLKIKTDIFVKFFGMWVAEGCLKGKGHVIISQNEGDNADMIREMLSEMNTKEFIERKKVNEFGNISINFEIHDARLNRFLKPLGKVHQKYIPDSLKNLAPNYLKTLFDWFLMGDGRTRISDGYIAKEVFSISKKLINDLHEIAIKFGRSGNIHVREPYDHFIGERLIRKENMKLLYFLHLSTTKGIYLDERHVEITEEDYNGNVYCVSVPNSTFYARDNGKAFWTGNSRSEISLNHVSHMITEIWWDKVNPNLVKAKIKVLSTPSGQILRSLVNDGVKVGISSRALGSVQETSRGLIVEDNLSIICFDMVSTPSTPNAFMLREAIERDLMVGGKMVYTKGDRINRILNELKGYGAIVL